MQKLKTMLQEEFNLTKKFIAERNAKLAMIHKIKQRNLEKQNLNLKESKFSENLRS